MKNKQYQSLGVLLFFLILLAVPFIQSLFFSSKSNGTITISKEIDADYIKSDKKIVLLFFGYVGCKYVCTPDLEKIAKVYKSDELEGIKNDIDVIFVNLKPEVYKDAPDIFAKSFDPHFKGIYLTKREIQNIDRNFGLSFSDDISDKTQMNHSDNLYLLINNSNVKILENIYFMHPLNSNDLTSKLIKLDKQYRL